MIQVLRNIGTLAQCKDEGTQNDIHPISEAALVWENEKIIWLGNESELPENYAQAQAFDAQGKTVIPGLIDCHTHLAFGGWRADEFEMRLQGRSYLEIAKAGGGILSTVTATRKASHGELLSRCRSFLPKMNALGVTTVECKSGYGLDKESELKLLAVYNELKENEPTHIVSTFLGAHMVPSEFKEKREEYLSLLTEELIPEVAKKNLASFCDIFVEESAFSLEEARTILGVAKQHGLTPKLHVDQLTPGKGAELAADMGAASADHLEHISEEGIKRLAEKGVVAVALPLASLYTNEPYLNARPLLEAGVDVAVATDFNPGSAPSYDLPLALLLSCNGNRLTPHEALKGATIIAAKALQIQDTTGSLEPGKSADFAILNTESINHWLYHYQPNCCLATVSQGKLLYGSL